MLSSFREKMTSHFIGLSSCEFECKGVFGMKKCVHGTGVGPCGGLVVVTHAIWWPKLFKFAPKSNKWRFKRKYTISKEKSSTLLFDLYKRKKIPSLSLQKSLYLCYYSLMFAISTVVSIREIFWNLPIHLE